MDFLAVIISIAGLFSCSVIYVLTTNAAQSWKYLLAATILFEIVLISLNALLSNINILQYYDTAVLALPLGFLLAGIYSLKKSTRKKELLESNKTGTGGGFKNILKPIPLFLLFFIPLFVLQTAGGKLSIYLIAPVAASALILIDIIAVKTELKKKYQAWEILGITNVIASLYLIFSFFLPGDYSFQAKLFTPGNSGVDILYIILLAVLFITIFSIGFFAKSQKQGNKK